MTSKISYLGLQNQNFLFLSHKTLQKDKDQQSFQNVTNFGSWDSIILKILTVFDKKWSKSKNCDFLVFYEN